MRILSFISLSVPAGKVCLAPRILKHINDTVKSLKRDKTVSAAHAWFHVSVGSQPRILRRSDFLRVKALAKPQREQLALCLSMNQGFRAGEVVQSLFSHFDLDDGVVYVADSKDLKLYPLPLDRETAYAYTAVGDVSESYVLGRHPRYKKWTGQPVTVVHYIQTVKRWAREAGVLGWGSWHPTMLRAYFAKEWVRRGGDIVLLSKMMRHHSPFTTWMYLRKFVYVEDLRREMEHLYVPREKEWRNNGEDDSDKRGQRAQRASGAV